MKSSGDRGPPSSPIFRGELIATAARMAVGRRPRSKVRIRVVGASSMGWIEAAEAWGAEVESVVVDIPDHFKDIRRKVSLTPTTTPQDGLRLLPLGPWDGCLLATIGSASETQLVTALFKRWRPAVAILSILEGPEGTPSGNGLTTSSLRKRFILSVAGPHCRDRCGHLESRVPRL